MEQRRYLRCLGQPVLFAPNGELVRFRTKKHLALLIYIAVEPRSHRRDRLAELLWPKGTPTEARHSLATALSTLRPRLGPDGLESGRDHVHLAPGQVTLDLERLEAGDVLGTEMTGPLEVAAFLEGFDIPDSSEFTHWKDRQQARLLPMIKDALVILIDRCRRTGDFRQIERLADRMLALDYLSEEAIRAKMEARAFAGDRLTALEIFEEWRANLAEDLQAAPSELVEGMAIRLRRRGWERTTLPKIPNVPTDQWRGRPFIGRAGEYRALYEAWEDVRNGTLRYALILGDSGVGKSTLVERLTTAVGLEGAAISRVQCYDLEREIPYSTLSSLVLGLLDRPGVSATAPDSLAELSRIIPEVRRRFPNIPPSHASQGETTRIRLTEAFLDMLTAIGGEHPLVLVIDDLHLADDVSLAVIHLVMKRSRESPLMVLLIARLGELSRSHHALRLRDVMPLRLCEIEVLPFSDCESREMLASLVQADETRPTATEERTIVRASAGYPMILELLVQDWKASREQSLALSVDAMTAECGDGTSIPAAYRHILDRTTHSLDTTTQNVLNLASLLGRRLNDFNMYAIVDLSAGQTMRGMAELATRRILRDGNQGLEFVNELVRTAAYVEVPAALRRILHSNIADRLIQKQAQGDHNLGLEIAWHCIRAGRREEATDHLLRGAREAIRYGAPHGAERGLATALSTLAEPERTEACLLLAEALQELGDWRGSLAVLDQINEPRENHLSTDLAFVLRLRARRRLGHIGHAESQVLPTTLLAFIESTADTRSRIRAAVEVASVFDMLRTKAPSARIMRTLVSLADSELNVDDRAHLLLAMSMLLYNTKDFTSSLKCIHDATTLLEDHKAPNSVLAMLQNGTGSIHAKQGSYEAAIPAYLNCYETAYRIGNDRLYLQASANLSLSFMRIGEYDSAVEWAERTLAVDAIDITPGFHVQAAESAVLSYAMMGKEAHAVEMIHKRREEFASWGSIGISQAWALYSADSYAMLGRTSDALQEGRRGTEGTNNQLHMDFCAGPYARWLARTSGYGLMTKATQEKLDVLVLNLESYDVMDQADILNARCWLSSRDGQPLPRDVDGMLKRLNALPRAVGDQLRRMGMLDLGSLELSGFALPYSAGWPTHTL